MYLRIVLWSQPVNLLIAWILISCRCSSFSSCTSLPLNKFSEPPPYGVVSRLPGEEWGKFNRHYGDFCTDADNSNALG